MIGVDCVLVQTYDACKVRALGALKATVNLRLNPQGVICKMNFWVGAYFKI